MRFMAAKSVNEGRKGAAINVLFFLPISAIVVSNAGFGLVELYKCCPGILPSGMAANDVLLP
ncbi:MAG: hypothetical protein CM1200mP1_08340 [Candidatus Neomarinimicrobiota bacterium]|nr:MAG: hypothetical protein CM1200mP1_08340 [Candidatus Neomarinimicrobiota bacterium]